MLKSYTEMTIEEYYFLMKIHYQSGMTQDEINQMYNLVRAFVQQHIATCLSCTGNIRDAKNIMFTWFNLYQAQIEANLFPPAVEAPVKTTTKKKNA